MSKFDFDNIAPAKQTSKFDFDNVVPAAEEKPSGMDPTPTGPEGVFSYDRMSAAWAKATDAVQTTVDAMIPMAGFSKPQMEQTQKAMYNVFQRPLGALAALAVETPFAEPDVGVWETLGRGFLNPEEYTQGEIAVALTDAGMEPNSAAALATLGQFGYYMGAGRAFQKAFNLFEIRNTKATIESLAYRVNDMEFAGEKYVKLPKEMTKMFGEKPATRITADMYLKSRGYRLAGDGIKLVDPKTAAQFGQPTVEGVVRAGEAKVARIEKFADIEKLGVTKEQFADRIPGLRQLRAAARGRDTARLKEFMTRRGASKLIEADPALEGIRGEKLVMDAAKTVFDAFSKNTIRDALYQQVEVAGQKLAFQTVQDFVNLTLQVDEALAAGTATAEMLTQYNALAAGIGLVPAAPEIVRDAEGRLVTLGEVPEEPVVPALRDVTKPVTVEEAVADLKAVTTRRERVGKGALIVPAETLLKRLGLDEYIGSPVRQALQDTRIELASKVEFLVKTMQEHKQLVGEKAFPASVEKIWRYMDKGIPANKKDTIEAKIARRFRKETEEMLRRINEVNRFAGLPEIKGIKDYIFHMVNAEVIDDMIKTGQIPEGLKKIIRPGVSTKLFLKTAVERKGMPEEYLVKDVYEIMRAMYAIDLKYINLQRALAEIEPYLKGVKTLAASGEKWDATSVTYVDKWINHAVKRLPTETDLGMQASLDNLIDFVFGVTQRVRPEATRPDLSFQQLTGLLSVAIQTGALGFRVKVALRNLLQSSFDWVMYGTDPYLKGQEAYLTEEGQSILKKSRVWKTRMPIEAQDLNTLKTWMKKGSILYRKADMRNVSVGLLTRYYHAKDTLGLSDKEAIEWADTDLAKTQWSYTQEDLPAIYWSATGRTLATFGSWWMNFYTNFLPELVGRAYSGKASDGREVSPQERAGILRFFALLGTIFFVKKITGAATGTPVDYLGVLSPLPFGESPQGAVLLGMADMAQGMLDVNDKKYQDGVAKVGRAGQVFVPYGITIKETYRLFMDPDFSIIDYLFYTDQEGKKKVRTPFF